MNAVREILNGRPVGPEGGAAEPEDACGVFETLAVQDGRPAFFAEHAARFAAGCAHFGLRQAPEAGQLRRAAESLIQAAGCGAGTERRAVPEQPKAFAGPSAASARRPCQGALRWSAWRSASEGPGWRMRLEPPRPDSLKPAWRAALSPYRLAPPGPDAAHKHLGRRLWREALAAGRAAGLEEVLLGDEAGRLVEGARSNLFLVTGGVLRTPSLDCGPLPGIARARVLELAKGLGIGVEERAIAVAELRESEEIFMTNSLIGLKPVSALDGRPFLAPGRLAERIASAWRASG